MDDAMVKPGDVLAGKYRVERVLGQGAMGVVVAATHIPLDRRVALKFMTRGGRHLREYEERFHREARAAAKLQSQHAAKVLDFGTLESDAPYIVMEYLEGRDLAKTLEENGPFGVSEAVTLVLQACDALAEAHAVGIVHRDVKPANLFLTKSTDGSPCLKLVDFGVAKLQGGELALTDSGVVLGSPLYMSPEVMNGKSRDVDGRGDIWSLGVSFYEMLAGANPFARPTLEALMKAVFFDPPPPMTDYRADVPPRRPSLPLSRRRWPPRSYPPRRRPRCRSRGLRSRRPSPSWCSLERSPSSCTSPCVRALRNRTSPARRSQRRSYPRQGQ